MTKAKVYHDGAVSGARRIVDMALTIFLGLLYQLVVCILQQIFEVVQILEVLHFTTPLFCLLDNSHIFQGLRDAR